MLSWTENKTTVMNLVILCAMQCNGASGDICILTVDLGTVKDDALKFVFQFIYTGPLSKRHH